MLAGKLQNISRTLTISMVLWMIVSVLFIEVVSAARLKDISHIQGVRNNQLIGYGLVVGLMKTGDDQKILYTIQSLTSMLARMGIKVDAAEIKAENVAAVTVTANLPPFSPKGGSIDVVVSSIGNAKSLYGGTLLMTPLKAADGQIYAVSQGPITLGGYSFAGQSGSSVQKNHPTVGRIPGGAIIEQTVDFDINSRSQVVLSLMNQDFTTAVRVTDVINNYLDGPYSKARNSATVVVEVPSEYQTKVVEMVARIEGLQVETDRPAKVVLNERTGTVVMGATVRISTIAIAHGNLKIHISNRLNVSQPGAFSPKGKTVVTPETSIRAVEEENIRLATVEETVTIGDLVIALNAIGVTPRDMINILQSIKAAGALEAELEVL